MMLPPPLLLLPPLDARVYPDCAHPRRPLPLSVPDLQHLDIVCVCVCLHSRLQRHTPRPTHAAAAAPSSFTYVRDGFGLEGMVPCLSLCMLVLCCARLLACLLLNFSTRGSMGTSTSVFLTSVPSLSCALSCLLLCFSARGFVPAPVAFAGYQISPLLLLSGPFLSFCFCSGCCA